MDMFQTLKILCEADGTSGNEKKAAVIAADLLGNFMPSCTDKLGNVIGDTGVEGEKILLDAHLDRIGLVVTAVDEKGFVKVARVGGVDPITLAASEAVIHGKEDVFGVITSTPPHLLKSSEKKAREISEIAIDTGMNKEEAEKVIQPGDRITLKGDIARMLNDRVCGAALDDRCGVVAILRCLELLGDKLSKLPLRVMFSACEETGGSGAGTGSFAANAAESIVVDVSFAKAPGVKDSITAELGKGTLIGYAPSLDFNMSRRLETLAAEKGILYQTEVMGSSTGTNADDIGKSGYGCRTALLSIPQRNMHTCVEVVDMKDIEATARLMTEYILSKEGEIHD